MASDFYIHIASESLLGGEFTNFEEVLRYFNHNVIGSKYYNPQLREKDPNFREKYRKACEIVGHTPAIWVGEVSWLSAAFKALVDDVDPYEDIPLAVLEISNLFEDNELVTIDDAFIEKIKTALQLPNLTNRNVAPAEHVVAFLKHYKGKQCFVVVW